MKKIFFITPYPKGYSPSQRFRFEQYFQLLEAAGYKYRLMSFLDEGTWKIFYSDGHLIKKIGALIKGVLKRFTDLISIPGYDFVFIHREAMPIGPPVFEWLIAKCFRKKIIYDFDDAIWLTDNHEESSLLRIVKYRSKVNLIIRWAHKISCGNEYLCRFARTASNRTVLNPTTVDTEEQHNPRLISITRNPEEITIGWTGSHSTLKYLSTIKEALRQIETENKHIRILIIADQKPTDFNLSCVHFHKWNPDTEIQDLMKIDIGIMPLPDDPWTKGKCGFKAIQYMALGIPAVVSPVGVNTTIVDHGVNGFYATTLNEWNFYINRLIHDATLRMTMGQSARKKIVDCYSLNSNASTFLSLFE